MERSQALLAGFDLPLKIMTTKHKTPRIGAGKPIVMLDIDDVLCMSVPFNGYDVIDVFSGKRTDAELVFQKLFKSDSLEVLRRVHEEMSAELSYVISSTWRTEFDRDQMVRIFNATGASFVADSLRAGDAWCTPVLPGETRAQEINLWLQTHGRSEPFVILDDLYSGKSLLRGQMDSNHPWHQRIILCDECVGLLAQHECAIVAALSS